MNLLDLSHPIEAGMPVYPGTEPPILAEANTYEADGFREKRITMFSHTGTHMDAPSHILAGEPGLDDLPVGTFTGRALVVDISDLRDRTLSGAELRKRAGDRLGDGSGWDFLVLRTGWDRYWGEDRYFSGYPTLDIDAAGRLTGMKLKGVAMDCISADPADAGNLPVHRVLLGAGMVIIENLANLADLPADSFELFCFPLKIRDADGSPVRAVARLG